MKRRGRLPQRSAGRRLAVGALVVLATAALAFTAVPAAPLVVRVIAAVVAGCCVAGSLRLSARRGDLAGWFVIAGLAAGSRIVVELVA